ncbi:MAG: VWA domain-containing protein [Acidobacteriota bacterium]|nr:VWA domain-containing protein [Acidobacteriota bacterium]
MGSTLLLAPVLNAQQQSAPVPDAPAPQPTPLTEYSGPITPGIGAASKGTSSSGEASQTPTQAPPSQPDTFQQKPAEVPPAAEAYDRSTTLIRSYTNFVEIPVTVKDSKGNLVAGLHPEDFRLFENDQRVPIAFFTTSSFPLSMAFVIDQSLTSDVMAKVNQSLGAVQGALAPFDEIAIFSYNNGPQERTGFTGAHSARVPAVLAFTKATGRDMQVPVNSGPLAGCNIHYNGSCEDPVLQPGGSTGGGPFITIPKEIHTLNDAILAAAKELASRPKERRRIIYVVSDGKEYGSKASFKDVLHFLQQNQIIVYGTLVGDSARWGQGYLSRFHLPFTMYDNRLTSYVNQTGGVLYSANNINGIEQSYAKIAETARAQYTLGYYSHLPTLDSRFRKIEVRVDRPNVEVTAKRGYYPTAEDLH